MFPGSGAHCAHEKPAATMPADVPFHNQQILWPLERSLRVSSTSPRRLRFNSANIDGYQGGYASVA
jgi:hypothetical protein